MLYFCLTMIFSCCLKCKHTESGNIQIKDTIKQTWLLFARSVLHQKVTRSSWWSCIIIVIRLEPLWEYQLHGNTKRHLSLALNCLIELCKYGHRALVLTRACACRAKRKCMQCKQDKYLNTEAGTTALRLCRCFHVSITVGNFKPFP